MKSRPITAKIVTVTPRQAAAWLENNCVNRPIRPTAVTRYTADMAAGRWWPGTTTLYFDWDGNLTDGQHRLTACVESASPFVSVVVTGTDPAAYVAYDSGLRRTMADLLTAQGEVYSTTLGASIALAWKWQHGHLTGPVQTPTYGESLAWLEQNPYMREAVGRSESVRKPLSLPGSAVAAFLHHAARSDPGSATVFGDRLIDGEGLVKGDPILAFRNWAIARTRRAAGVHRVDNRTYLIALVKGWNAWMLGQDLASLSWNRGGVVKEELPALLNSKGDPIAIRDQVGHSGQRRRRKPLVAA